MAIINTITTDTSLASSVISTADSTLTHSTLTTIPIYSTPYYVTATTSGTYVSPGLSMYPSVYGYDATNPMVGQTQFHPNTGELFVFDGMSWIRATVDKVDYWETPEAEKKLRAKFPAIEKAWNDYQMLLKLYRPAPNSGTDALEDTKK